MQRLEAIVKGRGQGVGFRFFAKREAESLGLKGFVKNLGNGSVEVVVEGERNVLDSFLSSLKEGPSSGRVDNVLVSWMKPEKEFMGFSIRH